MKVLEIESTLPRRTRFRVSRPYRSQEIMEAMRDRILAIPGVQTCETKLRTGSILVEHEPIPVSRFIEVLPLGERRDSSANTADNTSPGVLRMALTAAEIATLFVELPLVPFVALEALSYGLDIRDHKRISPTRIAFSALGLLSRARKLRK